MESRQCICEDFYEPDEHNGCIKCPGFLERCEFCCNHPSYTCSRGICVHCNFDEETQECIAKDTLFYITLSQVALSAAMVLGIIALVMLLYKSCTRPGLL